MFPQPRIFPAGSLTLEIHWALIRSNRLLLMEAIKHHGFHISVLDNQDGCRPVCGGLSYYTHTFYFRRGANLRLYVDLVDGGVSESLQPQGQGL